MLKISRHIENTSAHHEEDATTRESNDSLEPQLEEASEHDPVRGYWTQHNFVFSLWRIFLTTGTRKLSFARSNPTRPYR